MKKCIAIVIFFAMLIAIECHAEQYLLTYLGSSTGTATVTINHNGDGTFTGTFGASPIYGFISTENGPYYKGRKKIHFYRDCNGQIKHVQYFKGTCSSDGCNMSGIFHYYGTEFSWHAELIQ